MDADHDLDDDSYWITGKALDRHFELEAALVEYSRLFKHESDDRAMVVVGGAFLETLLEHTLIAFLVDDERELAQLLRYDQPLGTYSGRVRMAYCLGLISKIVKADLALIGKIRNRFAHDLYASFADPQIKAWCESLQWHRQSYVIPPDDASARDLYYVGTHRIASHLNGIVCIARGEKRKSRQH